MNIGQLSEASGVSAKMIRHYESIGLIPKPPRSNAGYRRYQQTDVQLLSFVRRARAVGVAPAEIKSLVAMWLDRRRSAREVKALAARHLATVEARIDELKVIAKTISHLVQHCHGGDRPECPILDALADRGSDEQTENVVHVAASHRQPPRRSPGRR
ncbi:MAG: Cu(I)-responsive transcriptional regulator [Betaproteobacteria bacterium]|nr:Cu(I)-responsive transcriptional regulator [Betaproteobacteria bacterium]